ncbi:hypothetical protein Scep_027547 [Stephania cephalantha]|uniref:Uncharacterized protein n=1 Tax=Stephania cephalantha TaxID=152367 RepID=A0AAP0E853_9MAGN
MMKPILSLFPSPSRSSSSLLVFATSPSPILKPYPPQATSLDREVTAPPPAPSVDVPTLCFFVDLTGRSSASLLTSPPLRLDLTALVIRLLSSVASLPVADPSHCSRHQPAIFSVAFRDALE